MANSLSRSLVVAVILALTVPRMVYSLSIYDVIMLSQKDYQADDIVALIETTGSAFDLTAKDVTRLKEAGVSETVIQAMLAVVLLEPQENTNIPPEPTANRRSQETGIQARITESRSKEKIKGSLIPGKKLRSEPQLNGSASLDQPASQQRHATSNFDNSSIHPRKTSQPSIVIKRSQRGQSPPVTGSGGVFTSIPVSEEGAGGHQHQAIAFENIKILILRDEGAYSSIAARAASVVRRLQEARSIGKGIFKANHAGGGVHAVVFQTQDRREIVIISASGRDARAYQIRSGRHVNPDILADYWSDLLSDYWSIIFQATAPTRLNNLHEGEALQALSKQLTGVKYGNADQFTEAVRSLPREVFEHLELLATTVPREYGTGSNHEAEEQ
ncbi:MAG: hypothetical protein IIA77_08510 [Proteobacteria bacterium]|nr:hypothetical protein [Pseudomonadota bacterium]